MGCALATWSVQDPSFSHATDAPVRNLLGATGAIGSDLLMQLLGLASTVLVLPVAVWGWRIATHRDFDREWQRLLLWLGGTLLASGFASCLPNSPKWPLPSGLGGVMGDAMLRVPAFLLGPLSGVQLAVAAVILGTASLFAIFIAAGFGWQSDSPVKLDERWAKKAAGPIDDDEERASISLGWLVHGFLSIKARIGRWIARSQTGEAIRRAPDLAVSPRDRIAPTFDERVPRARDEVEAEEDEETEAPVATRKVVKPRAPKRSSNGYQPPSLNLLAAPQGDRPLRAEPGIDPGNRHCAGEGFAGLRRPRRDHQRASGTGGHAVRARAGARHQIVARDRSVRRHRPLDERVVRARRRRVGP